MPKIKYYPKDQNDQHKFISYLEQTYGFEESVTLKLDYREVIYFDNTTENDPDYWIYYGGSVEYDTDTNDFTLFSFNSHPHAELMVWWASNIDNKVEYFDEDAWYLTCEPGWDVNTCYRKKENNGAHKYFDIFKAIADNKDVTIFENHNQVPLDYFLTFYDYDNLSFSIQPAIDEDVAAILSNTDLLERLKRYL